LFSSFITVDCLSVWQLSSFIKWFLTLHRFLKIRYIVTSPWIYTFKSFLGVLMSRHVWSHALLAQSLHTLMSKALCPSQSVLSPANFTNW
jgi:hypothetical protein